MNKIKKVGIGILGLGVIVPVIAIPAIKVSENKTTLEDRIKILETNNKKLDKRIKIYEDEKIKNYADFVEIIGKKFNKLIEDFKLYKIKIDDWASGNEKTANKAWTTANKYIENILKPKLKSYIDFEVGTNRKLLKMIIHKEKEKFRKWINTLKNNTNK